MFRRVFDHAPEGKEIREQLLTIKPWRKPAAEYDLKFCRLMAGSGWNEMMFKAVFLQVLNAEVLTELACRDDQETLNLLVDLAIRLVSFTITPHIKFPPL